MVELCDESGKVIRETIVNKNGLYHLATVTVTGVLREEAGNHFLKAKQIHIDLPTMLDIDLYETWKAENQ